MVPQKVLHESYRGENAFFEVTLCLIRAFRLGTLQVLGCSGGHMCTVQYYRQNAPPGTLGASMDRFEGIHRCDHIDRPSIVVFVRAPYSAQYGAFYVTHGRPAGPHLLDIYYVSINIMTNHQSIWPIRGSGRAAKTNFKICSWASFLPRKD